MKQSLCSLLLVVGTCHGRKSFNMDTDLGKRTSEIQPKRVTYLSGLPRNALSVISTHQWRTRDSESLQFSSSHEKAFWCNIWWGTVDRNPKLLSKRWSRICPAPKARERSEAYLSAQRWSTCTVKRYVAGIENGRVTLSRSFRGQGPAGNVIVANATHSFPVHLNDLRVARQGAKVVQFKTPIAHAFGSLSAQSAHLINQIHRLVTLARHVSILPLGIIAICVGLLQVPPDTTILTFNTRLHKEFIELFQSRGIIPARIQFKFIPTTLQTPTATQSFSAPIVYFAGEAVAMKNRQPTTSIDDRADDWYTLEDELCSWQLTSNRSEIRYLLDRHPMSTSARLTLTDAKISIHVPPIGDNHCLFEALVVSREDASSRQVRNHKDLLNMVRTAMAATRPLGCGINLRVFVGRDHSVASTEQIWRRADLVVAPHGAALAFMLFMRAGTQVIELGYHTGTGSDRKTYESALGTSGGMPWPAPYYWLVGVSASVHLYASMAKGSYNGGMTANLTDVAALIRSRIAPKLALLAKY